MLSSHGYVKVRVALDHPLADPNGYAYEHDLVLFNAGVRLAPNEIAHHRNGNKQDNRVDNLKVETRPEHAEEHDLGSKGVPAGPDTPRDAYGRFAKRGAL
jgi:hypothetical protein